MVVKLTKKGKLTVTARKPSKNIVLPIGDASWHFAATLGLEIVPGGP